MINKCLWAVFLPLIFFCSCLNNALGDGQLQRQSSADSIGVVPRSVQPDSPKLVKTASLQIEVKDAYIAAKTTSQWARLFGGLVMHQDIQSVELQRNETALSEDSVLQIKSIERTASLTVRVPSDKLEAFADTVAGMAHFIVRSSLDVEDKTLDYLDAGMKSRNRAAVLAKSAGPKATIASTQMLIDNKDEISNELISQRRIDMNVAYSTIEVSLLEVPYVSRQKCANTNVHSIQLPFISRIKEGFKSGWNNFLDVMVVLAHLWFFIFLGVTSYVIYRSFRRQKAIGAT
jgi:hypothetical protein